ncbi:hypothetical protein UFOVP1284_16 [uncultured Caudovirales phage]|uniref:Uncharacterized protein n=1 Tax=uncultured Caudovirales phage TaxID=2100421 RepID=A0A6J7X7T2_9CAUD|nr:hypothetical protein UFOVP1062_13 [uncultured Caudovirales phage]CAB4194771.1 hypothetical protein UFOVP1284_16 [uncultured Caudovirales phage]CAB4204992.1 hypothetical protein UFOVP1404_4 [uncultured Caudovirales phage]CAB5226727.1 hypothetical protein UFOVP1512_13 [uncultured Caudovirales phage]
MLSIPIIAEYDGKALDRAIKDFNQLETAGEKAHFLIKKAAIPAAAALGAVTAALTLAVQAAAEDEAQQAQLALTLENVTGATKDQVAAAEDMISAMSRATGTADSELRPALAVLVTGTKDVATATEALSLAQDIAIGSNKSLAEVSDALAKAYGGNMKGLQALSPEIKTMIQDGASLDDVMRVLGGTFGGAAATAANTAAGKFKILKNSLDETKESIGAALLPAVEAVLPVIQKFADWAQKNPDIFLTIAGAITAIATAILAVNFAMSLNPFSIIMIAVGALVTGIVIAYKKFETFRDIVNGVINGLMGTFELFANSFIEAINLIIRGMNILNPFSDIPSLPTISLPRIGGGESGAASTGGAARNGGVGDILSSLPPMPTLAAPLPSVGGGGGGSQGPSYAPVNGPIGYVGGIQDRMANRPDVTINVTGGISTSAQIGQSVVDALTQYTQVYGPLNLAIR